MMNGAASIDNTMDAIVTCTIHGSIIFSPEIWLTSTKLNSPACASASPVLRLTPRDAPNRRVSHAASANL